jgi:hypothetical protein
MNQSNFVLQIKLNYLIYRKLSANFMVVTTILFTHTTFLSATCYLICFIPIVKPFLKHWPRTKTKCSYRLSNLEIGLTEGVTGQKGMLTPRHLLVPLVCPGVRVSLIFNVDYSMYVYLIWALLLTADFSVYLAGFCFLLRIVLFT